MKLSVINHAYVGEQNQFKLLKDCGFDGCDFSLGAYFGVNGKFGDIFHVTDEQIIDHFTMLRKCADEAGIEICQTHGEFSGQVSSYVGGPAEYVRRARASFMATKILGAKYCIQHPFIYLERRYDVNREESIEMAIAVYRQYIPALEETGVKCCLENMHHGDIVYKHRCCTTLSRAQEMADMNDVLGENFRVCLDVGHCTVTEDDPVEAVKILGPRLACLHTHDNDGMLDLHAFPYCAHGVPHKLKPMRIDWDAFMKELAHQNYNGTLSFEIGAPGPAQLRPAGLRYLAAIGRHLSSIYEQEKSK